MNQAITKLKRAVAQLFKQPENCIAALSHAEYTTKSNLLFRATIGQHVRHITELFAELKKGGAAGIADYAKRRRDYSIERINTWHYSSSSLFCSNWKSHQRA